MRNVLFVSAFLAVASAAWGDTLLLSGGEAWTAMPNFSELASSLMSGSPYWDNASADGNQMSVGFLLTGTGGYSSGGPTYYDMSGNLAGSTSMDYAPQNYVSQDNGLSNPDAPTDLAFNVTGSGQVVTLLANLTSNHGSSFGYYDADQLTLSGAAASEDLIDGPGNLGSDIGTGFNFTIPYTDYGFYITTCTTIVAGDCTATTTWFSNSALDDSDGTHQHFAVFDSAIPGVYYVAIKDAFLDTNGEGYGDYNDIVFELDTNSTPQTPPPINIDPGDTPEPTTLVLMGTGLLGIGFVRMRTRKR